MILIKRCTRIWLEVLLTKIEGHRGQVARAFRRIDDAEEYVVLKWCRDFLGSEVTVKSVM